MLIYKFSTEQPYEHQIELAWSASLVLVVLVLGLNLAGQALAGKSNAKQDGLPGQEKRQKVK